MTKTWRKLTEKFWNFFPLSSTLACWLALHGTDAATNNSRKLGFGKTAETRF
jgi:hypothetical protein